VLFFFQILVNGIAAGAIYGLIAVGYSLTFMTTRTLNFALGMWVMLGGMLTYTLHVKLEIAAGIAGIAVVGALVVLGFAAERVSVHPFVHAGSDVWVMSTLAVGLLLIDAAELIWGRGQNAVPAYFGDDPIQVGAVSIRPQHVLAVASMCLVFIALEFFYRKTLVGNAYRAIAHDRVATALMGVNVRRMESLSYAIAAGLAGLAGFLIVPITGADPHFGTGLGFKAFAVAIIAGLAAPRGILICGLMYGAFEGLISGYLFTGIRDILGFGLMILALYYRPEGVFARRGQERA
jgi:branched-chain amino acid transport system permease protein